MGDAELGQWLAALGWGGAAVGGALLYVARRGGRWRRRAAWTLAVPTMLLALSVLAYRYRPWPSVRTWRPHPAVVVRVATRTAPRPLVLSTVRIDLAYPGLEVLTSEPAAGGRFAAMTTAEFLHQQGALVAINAHFFTPSWSRRPWDFYPRTGDPVRAVGYAAANGTVHSAQRWRGAILHFDAAAHATPGVPEDDSLWDAVGGRNILVTDGQAVSLANLGAAPRTAIGISDNGQTLIVAVIDGRQPGYSEGMTIPELAALMVELGAEHAIELDGGGSATLVVDSGSGGEVINSPIHTRIPGRMRPVSSHLGVRIGS